jgi:fumarate reductase (CoM/CoB) subunit A
MARTSERRELSTDVLIVGGGGAGAMAAIKAMEVGAEVLVVTKGPYPSGNSSIALAGYAVALGHADPRDNAQVHFEDAIRAGKGLNNQKLVRAYVSKIIELTKEMDDWGIDLIRKEGKLDQIPFEGHTYPRMVHHHLATGKAVMQCLARKSEEIGVQSLAHTIVGGLLKSDGRIAGAWGIDYRTGQLVVISAKTVILTTGGMGHLFPMTDNVSAITGEGYALAFDAGAKLIGMEFGRFLPTPCYPEKMRVRYGFMRLVNGMINQGGAKLYNGLGERFMLKEYPETGERDKNGEQIAKAIGLEICEGRAGAHGGVYLDVSDVPRQLQETVLSQAWDTAKRAGVDLSYQSIELAPYPHDLIGGVQIDEAASTNIPGLFAAGEAAGGSHGASRFGGAALADALAFGEISARSAVHYARELEEQPPVDERQLAEAERRLEALLSPKEGIDPSELKRNIQSIAHNYLNVVKNEEGLNKALHELGRIEEEMLPRMSAWAEEQRERVSRVREAIEVSGQLETAKAIATASLYRTESRGGLYGGNYRSDYPDQDDDNWLKNIVLTREQDGSISCSTVPPVTED